MTVHHHRCCDFGAFVAVGTMLWWSTIGIYVVMVGGMLCSWLWLERLLLSHAFGENGRDVF